MPTRRSWGLKAVESVRLLRGADVRASGHDHLAERPRLRRAVEPKAGGEGQALTTSAAQRDISIGHRGRVGSRSACANEGPVVESNEKCISV